MLTALVLTSIAAGGLTVLSAPLAFQGLLDLRYPQPREGPDRKPMPPSASWTPTASGCLLEKATTRGSAEG